MAKSKSPNKQKGPECDPQPGKRISRIQPAVGASLHKQTKAKDLKKAG